MNRDAKAGKLDFLFEEAETERAVGKLREWPAGHSKEIIDRD